MTSLAVAWIALAGAAAALDPSPRWEVEGKGYESDARLSSVRDRAAEAAAEALGRIRTRFGLEPGALPIRWVLDASLADPSRGRPDAFEAGRTAFEAGAVVVRVPARKHLRAPESVAVVVRHEAAHAVLASALGSKDRYEGVGPWLREGLALLVSGEGGDAVRESLAYTAFQDRPAASFLKGVRARDATPAEGFLAVRWLEARLGEPGLRSFISSVSRSADVESSLVSYLGFGAAALEAAALESARTELAALLPPDREDVFRASIRARGGGAAAEAGAARAWEKLLAEDARGPLASTLEYLLARRDIDLGDVRGAMRRLQASAERERSLWRQETLLLLGEGLLREGRAAEARERFLEVLEVFGEDAGPAERARRGLEAAVVK